jgi:hypothetical protein
MAPMTRNMAPGGIPARPMPTTTAAAREGGVG